MLRTGAVGMRSRPAPWGDVFLGKFGRLIAKDTRELAGKLVALFLDDLGAIVDA